MRTRRTARRPQALAPRPIATRSWVVLGALAVAFVVFDATAAFADPVVGSQLGLGGTKTVVGIVVIALAAAAAIGFWLTQRNK